MSFIKADTFYPGPNSTCAPLSILQLGLNFWTSLYCPILTRILSQFSRIQSSVSGHSRSTGLFPQHAPPPPHPGPCYLITLNPPSASPVWSVKKNTPLSLCFFPLFPPTPPALLLGYITFPFAHAFKVTEFSLSSTLQDPTQTLLNSLLYSNKCHE